MRLEDKTNIKRHFNGLRINLYFWCNCCNNNRRQHEKSLRTTNSFDKRGYETKFDRKADRFEGKAKRNNFSPTSIAVINREDRR